MTTVSQQTCYDDRIAMNPRVDSDLLTGLTDQHVVALDGWLMHREMAVPFARLKQAAAQQGMVLAVASGFRAFERQLAIWNAKARGLRPVLDDQGQPVELHRLSPRDQVFAILRWSALPGASRHHWGTDLDVWDPAAVAPDYRLQLVPVEYDRDGPFARLGCWLDQELENYGFYRPYAVDRGGVAPEPWHLSYRPLADYYAGLLTPALLAPVLKDTPGRCGQELALCDTVLRHLDEIFERFVVA